ALAFLGMPEHAEHEARRFPLDRLDRLAVVGPGAGAPAFSQIGNALMMVGLDDEFLGPDGSRGERPGLEPHLMLGPRTCNGAVDVVSHPPRQVGLERPASGDVQYLHPTADAEQ